MRNLYIVKNITSAETNSAGVFRKDATIGADTYSLIKKDSNVFPTGEESQALSYDEFNANLHSATYADGNALFNFLEKTSHRISRGTITLAYVEFNLITDPAATQPMKDFINDMFLDHFSRIPRDLT